MKIGKYMTARAVGMAPREVYTIHARDGAIIGMVEWYPRWRQYVFAPDHDAALSHECLTDLARFCKEQGAMEPSSIAQSPEKEQSDGDR